MPGKRLDERERLVVSILARPEGRALRRGPRRRRRGRGVSILARPEGRALPPDRLLGLVLGAFQSSLGPKAERYQAAPVGGEPSGEIVSILARPEGRALRRQRRLPRPSARAVSILARPEGRALRDLLRDVERAVVVSILARPEGRALLASELSGPGQSLVFQSSLGPKAERYEPTAFFVLSWARFNPRSARRPSATSQQSREGSSGGHGFNPRSARRPSATVPSTWRTSSWRWFQSSLGPKAERY